MDFSLYFVQGIFRYAAYGTFRDAVFLFYTNEDVSASNIVNVNRRKLLRYASRRNRKERLEQILQTIDHD